jgi:hypothetical protein
VRFLDVDTTCLTQYVFAYGKLVFSLFGRVCVCVCVCVFGCGGAEGEGGGLCNIVVEFHVHMKLVTLIKIYVNESCNKVRIDKTLLRFLFRMA